MGQRQGHWALSPHFIDEKLRTRDRTKLTTLLDLNNTAPFPPLVYFQHSFESHAPCSKQSNFKNVFSPLSISNEHFRIILMKSSKGCSYNGEITFRLNEFFYIKKKKKPKQTTNVCGHVCVYTQGSL